MNFGPCAINVSSLHIVYKSRLEKKIYLTEMEAPKNDQNRTTNSGAGHISVYASDGTVLSVEEYGARLRRAYQPRFSFRAPSPPLPSPLIERTTSGSATARANPSITFSEFNSRERTDGSRHCSACGAVGHYRNTCRARQSSDGKGGVVPHRGPGWTYSEIDWFVHHCPVPTQWKFQG